jgi:hypothetical protein
LAGTGYSTLQQIDAKNVTKLVRVWTYHMIASAPPKATAAPAPGSLDAGVRSLAVFLVTGGMADVLMAACRQPAALGPVVRNQCQCRRRRVADSLGITDSVPPDQQKTRQPNTVGRWPPLVGWCSSGPRTTAVFGRLDRKTGREVWTAPIDVGAHSAPITFQDKDARQHIVVTATGGGVLGR